MTAQPDETPVPAPYEPFPDFVTFADMAEYDPNLINTLGERWAELKADAEEDRVRQVVETATRWAAIDTGAIEGLYDVDRGITFNIATSAQAIESAHEAVGGEEAVNHILDAIKAYDHVQVLAHNDQPITEVWIRELHATICESQEFYDVYVPDHGMQKRKLEKGAYKTERNRSKTAKHYYAEPGDQTQAEMGRLVGELNLPVFHDAHPVLQAAYAHYAFVCIHPFSDGNGRVARALASAYLYRSPGVPLVIFADQKGQYITALEQADQGDPAPFTRFIGEVTIDAVGMLTTALTQPVLPEVREIVADVARNLVSQDGLPHSEIDALEQRVREAWMKAMNDELAKLGDLTPLRLQIKGYNQTPHNSDTRYRLAPGSRHVQLDGTSPAPAEAAVTRLYAVRIPKAGTGLDAAFQVFDAQNDRALQDVMLREVYPTLSGALEFRLATVARTHLIETLNDLRTRGENAVKKAGYI